MKIEFKNRSAFSGTRGINQHQHGIRQVNFIILSFFFSTPLYSFHSKKNLVMDMLIRALGLKKKGGGAGA